MMWRRLIINKTTESMKYLSRLLFDCVCLCCALTACAGNNAGSGQSQTSGSADNASETPLTEAVTAMSQAPSGVSKVKEISQAQFVALVGDYNSEPSAFKFVGQRPAIVDFNAEWCGPCRRLAPILEELAVEYAGRVDFYSVNVDDNPEIAQALRISSIPMVLLCPMNGTPQSIVGLYPKDEIVNAMNYVFGWKK